MHVLTVTSITRPSHRLSGAVSIVPFVRISGRWLEQFGFAKGSRIFVSGEMGKLVLTLNDPAHLAERND